MNRNDTAGAIVAQLEQVLFVWIHVFSLGEIKYKKDELHQHLTAPDPYWMEEKSANRDWKRIDSNR